MNKVQIQLLNLFESIDLRYRTVINNSQWHLSREACDSLRKHRGLVNSRNRVSRTLDSAITKKRSQFTWHVCFMALVPPMRAAFATGGDSVPEFLVWGALEGPRSSVTHVAPFRMLSILEPTRGFQLFLKDDSFVIFLDDSKFFFIL